MGILQNIQNRLLYPAAYTYVSFQSQVNGLKSIGKKDKVVFAKPYQGEKILLMALFEKGEVRQDILSLLASAKRQGVYVLCINTLKIGDPVQYENIVDCYIEKYNFGRDFGSYQSGFNYLYKQGLAGQCPRLLMLNDSVFYSESKNCAFLADMFDSPVEALGGTENFEIEHHLGSFCIAFSGNVLRHPKFRRYWAKYRCSDVRPRVIKRGEMGLSKVLRSCVSSPENFRAQYDIAAASAYLRANPEVLNGIHALVREDVNPEFRSFSFGHVSEKIVSKYLHNTASLIGVNLEGTEMERLENLPVHFAGSIDDYSRFIGASVIGGDHVADTLTESLKNEALYAFLDFFIKGSQVHQNGIFLHRIGLPFIKLDGLYRGAFSVRDVETIADDLDEEQATKFRRLMYARPFGRNILFGWKRAAFERGLI
ncbi:hypothetical protein [Pseudomonas nitroreducens]|uniref:hypothetical protein n=1 Tax=Pseudomonas nitroreducens TaxID=46680 RepID=UPI0028A9E922|nr:hypothetical protein [Pseudomonas nitroreducens]